MFRILDLFKQVLIQLFQVLWFKESSPFSQPRTLRVNQRATSLDLNGRIDENRRRNVFFYHLLRETVDLQ